MLGDVVEFGLIVVAAIGGFFLAGFLLVAGVTVLTGPPSCSEKGALYATAHEWRFWTGCYLKTENGNFLSADAFEQRYVTQNIRIQK